MSAHPLHLVQFAGSDEARLARNVGAYLAEGLERDQRCVVIATRPHLELFAQELECRGLLRSRRARAELVLLDAHDVARDLLRDGVPDQNAFEEIVGSRVRKTIGTSHRGLRAYGEIVGVYWSHGRRAAAARLEELWNTLMREVDFPLYCGYPIDVFDTGFAPADLDAVMCAHATVVSGVEPRAQAALENALHRVLGASAARVTDLMRAEFRPGWSALPEVEAKILWLRNNLRAYADEILAHAAAAYCATPT
jgi:hypothetical protein